MFHQGKAGAMSEQNKKTIRIVRKSANRPFGAGWVITFKTVAAESWDRARLFAYARKLAIGSARIVGGIEGAHRGRSGGRFIEHSEPLADPQYLEHIRGQRLRFRFAGPIVEMHVDEIELFFEPPNRRQKARLVDAV